MPPPPVISNSAISREANREGGQIHRNYGSYRSGYYAYNNHWRDDDFCYPYYAFSYSPRCYPSPFYYYPQCPGYVSYVRIDLGYFSFRWTQGDVYNWRPRSSGYDWYNDRSYHNSALDRSVQDIYDAFDRGRVDYMNDLIPSRGLVGIEVDRAAQYRISADDFYDMLRDMVETTDTITYKIKRVRLYRGGASIEAEHVFRDPWGRTERVQHFFGLRESGYGYEITNFRSEG